jgi:hypothetical protein
MKIKMFELPSHFLATCPIEKFGDISNGTIW